MNQAMIHIRQLTNSDWACFRTLRLESLQATPEYFATSYAEAAQLTDQDFQKILTDNHVFGAFIEDTLVANIGYYPGHSTKTMHIGNLWGMYTQKEHRKKGIGLALLNNIIQHARNSDIRQLHLKCTTNNQGAFYLYEQCGFSIYGTEPRAIKVDDAFYDADLMVLKLN